MRLFIYFIVVTLVFSSCHSRHINKANKKIERRANDRTGGAYTEYTPASYIQRYKEIAVEEMRRHGIPASITLAQGILESGNGNSPLARYANNHFGIKCTPDWEGQKYYQDDDRSNDCFRVYDSPEASFEDHSVFLKRKRYAVLYNYKSTDYKKWAKGLKKAGYATNPKYPRMLIDLIERYDLHQYDEKQKGRARNNGDNIDKPVKTETTGHTVQRGDTLHSISIKYGTTVDKIKNLNKLKNNTIYIGQQLRVGR